MKNTILKNLDKYLDDDWKQFEKDCEYYDKLKKSKPMNRARFIKGLGWYIPAMNTKRKASEINRMRIRSKDILSARCLRIADKLQNLETKKQRKETNKKWLQGATIKLQCEK